MERLRKQDAEESVTTTRTCFPVFVCTIFIWDPLLGYIEQW